MSTTAAMIFTLFIGICIGIQTTISTIAALSAANERKELRQQPAAAPRRQAALLELEPLHVEGWIEGLKLLNREDYYDNER